MRLEELLSNIDPILYHGSDLRNVKMEERDADILREGIIPPSMYDRFKTDIEGTGYGESAAPRDANMLDHICVWVQDERTPLTLQETINTARGGKDDNITFILNPELDYELVNDNTERDSYQDSEGLVKGPIEINRENIEAVVIAKKKIMNNHREEGAIPSQGFWKEKIEKVTEALEDRGIPVYLTQNPPNY